MYAYSVATLKMVLTPSAVDLLCMNKKNEYLLRRTTRSRAAGLLAFCLFPIMGLSKSSIFLSFPPASVVILPLSTYGVCRKVFRSIFSGAAR